MAFEPADKAEVVGMFNDEDGDGSCVRYQPNFDLIREDNYEVHRVLETLADGIPALAGLGTVVMGSELVAQPGMGSQYFHSADAVRAMAEAYRDVTPSALAAAIETVRPEFDSRSFVAMPAIITEKFAVIRDELSIVAENNWAMIAGMF
ncbi:hypothetical protein [Asticcacaulis solisilvae]|uniref:hypothetical protein n=1 Tax=Asticcacaulis solisilvae TaxID=1217274 RepID=UPI003FD8AFD2